MVGAEIKLTWRTLLLLALLAGACGSKSTVQPSDAGAGGSRDTGVVGPGEVGGKLDASAVDGTAGVDGGWPGEVGRTDVDGDWPGEVGGMGPSDAAATLDSPVDRTPDVDGPARVDAPVDAAAPPPDGKSDVPPGTNGAACSVNAECRSSVCADGVCCDQACGQCSACTRALTGGVDGVCAPVLNGQDPHSACVDETGTNACGRDGLCDGKGSCRLSASGRICQAAACSGSTMTTASLCNGAGQCVPGTSAICANSTACLPDGTGCGTTYLPGVPCTDGSQCASGFCVDNTWGNGKLCCASACPTCKACNQAGTACVNKFSGVTDPTCGTSPSQCQYATCDGAGACQVAINGTSCGQGLQCKGGTCQAAPTVFLSEDFAATTWTNKILMEWSGSAPMRATLSGGKLFLQDGGDGSSTYVRWDTVVNPAPGLAIQAEMAALSTVRSLEYVMLGEPSNFIIGGLQRDTGKAVLLVNLAGVQVVRVEVAAPTPINVTQMVRVELVPPNTIRVLVDGAALIQSTALNLSQLPASMNVCLGANADRGQVFAFDNLLVTAI